MRSAPVLWTRTGVPAHWGLRDLTLDVFTLDPLNTGLLAGEAFGRLSGMTPPRSEKHRHKEIHSNEYCHRVYLRDRTSERSGPRPFKRAK
jgi:hypothetical protein